MGKLKTATKVAQTALMPKPTKKAKKEVVTTPTPQQQTPPPAPPYLPDVEKSYQDWQKEITQALMNYSAAKAGFNATAETLNNLVHTHEERIFAEKESYKVLGVGEIKRTTIKKVLYTGALPLDTIVRMLANEQTAHLVRQSITKSGLGSLFVEKKIVEAFENNEPIAAKLQQSYGIDGVETSEKISFIV